jgi:hypothetical protein
LTAHETRQAGAVPIPGNAGASTAANQNALPDLALRQIPPEYRSPMWPDATQTLRADRGSTRSSQEPPGETAAATKPESCDGLPGVATRLLLLISREPMQEPLAYDSVGDSAEVSGTFASMAAPSRPHERH